MRKIWVVIRREFIERVRTKWFIIGTVLGPVFMFGVIALPILMAEKGARVRNVVIVDATTTGFGERLTAMLAQSGSVQATRLTVDTPDLEGTADSLAGRGGPGAGRVPAVDRRGRRRRAGGVPGIERDVADRHANPAGHAAWRGVQ
jgi:hypothetical protein